MPSHAPIFSSRCKLSNRGRCGARTSPRRCRIAQRYTKNVETLWTIAQESRRSHCAGNVQTGGEKAPLHLISQSQTVVGWHTPFAQRESFHMLDGPEQEKRDEIFLSQLGKRELKAPFPSRWTCPKVQPWLYGYDAYQEVHEALARERFDSPCTTVVHSSAIASTNWIVRFFSKLHRWVWTTLKGS